MKTFLSLILTGTTLISFGQSKDLFVSADGRQNFGNYAMQTEVSISQNTFKPSRNVSGSQFLYTDWADGYAVDNNDVKHAALFNYDKVREIFYMKEKDKDQVFIVTPSLVKSISISDGTNSYTFGKIQAINGDKMCLILTKGRKYSFCGVLKTKYIPADYNTNGIISSGNLYEEYQDELHYYVVLGDGTAKEVNMKKKALKSVFGSERDKVDKFLSDNATADVNEKLVEGLVNYLNQL